MTLYNKSGPDHEHNVRANSADAGCAIADPAQTPAMASACSYSDGGLTCGCPGYVNNGAGYCLTCSHSGSFHW